jgi:hypothetical protein
MRWTPLLTAVLSWQLLAWCAGAAEPQAPADVPDKSAYFAFVDREFIFTVEMVKPGIPVFNFVSMSDKEKNLVAKEIRLTLENRKADGKFFLVDTGDAKQPVILPSIHMRPRSSFGVRLQGDFDEAGELLGAAVRLGAEDFKMVPLTSFAFENLVLKVNRINLGSPDFSDDWKVLKMEFLGSRMPVRR